MFMSDAAERLCDGARAGDMAAASELVTLFSPRIFAFFRRLSGSEADAEDLTQKTFVKVWSSLPSFAGRSSFSTWIHGIAHHVYVDWRRRRSVMDFRPDEWWEACVAEGPSPFEEAAEREMACQLYTLVEQLDDETKEAVHLHYYQGLSLKETAEVLSIATSTLKYRLREAVNSLRAQTAEPKLRTK
jgi:RNA polymerase sigma-70 factor, ECF subfamily